MNSGSSVFLIFDLFLIATRQSQKKVCFLFEATIIPWVIHGLKGLEDDVII